MAGVGAVAAAWVTVACGRDGRCTKNGRAAIQLTTAAGICTMADLMREGKLPQRGFVRQEQCALSDFLANRFGSLYLRGKEVTA